MKKLLLTLSLVASFASVSAFPGQDKLKAAYAACTFANAKNAPVNVAKFATQNTTHKLISGTALAAVVGYAGKKAYDRYKAWKKAKADENEVTA